MKNTYVKNTAILFVSMVISKIIGAVFKIPLTNILGGVGMGYYSTAYSLYTPIFAIARIAGWSAHRLEELSYNGKIMRPAYKNVCEHKEFIPMDKR